MELNHVLHGSGDVAVVLLHGFLEDSSMWKDCLPALKSQIACHGALLTVDLPGHGASPCFDHAPTIENIAQAVWGLLDHLKINYAAVVGHSLGGYVACEMVNLCPTRIQGVCLLNSTTMADSDAKKIQRDQAMSLATLDQDRYVSTAIRGLFRPLERQKFKGEVDDLICKAKKQSALGIIHALNAMKNRANNAGQFGLNTFYKAQLIGKKDPIIDYQFALNELKMTKPDNIVLSDHSGHMSLLEDPKQCEEFLVEFAQAVLAEHA